MGQLQLLKGYEMLHQGIDYVEQVIEHSRSPGRGMERSNCKDH